MAKPLPDPPRRDLTIVGLAPSSPETLREIARVVPANFHGTVFVVSRAGQQRPPRAQPAGRRRDNSRPDAAAYAGLRLRPKRNKERNRKRA